jgi:hypothetical protein
LTISSVPTVPTVIDYIDYYINVFQYIDIKFPFYKAKLNDFE